MPGLIAPQSSYTLRENVIKQIVQNRLFKNTYFLIHIEPVGDQTYVLKLA